MSGLKLPFEKKWHCQISSGGYKSFKNVKFFACGGLTNVAPKSGAASYPYKLRSVPTNYKTPQSPMKVS